MAEAHPQTYYYFVKKCVTSLPHFEVAGMQRPAEAVFFSNATYLFEEADGGSGLDFCSRRSPASDNLHFLGQGYLHVRQLVRAPLLVLFITSSSSMAL